MTHTTEEPVRPSPPKIPRPTPAPRVSSPAIDAIEEHLASGEMSLDDAEEELNRLMLAGTPLLEQCDSSDERIVTFLHRDEQAENVLIFINRLTDEKNLMDSLMRRVGETSVRSISFRMRTDWRASYCFLVSYPGQRPVWLTEGNQVQLRAALDRGVADDFNPRTCFNRAGTVMSVAELTAAPTQEHILSTHELRELPQRLWLEGPQQRRLDVVEIGEPEADAPMLILFDGDVWSGMGLAVTAERTYEAGKLSACRIVLLHSGGVKNRWADLSGEAPIADYLADQLLPWLKDRGISPAPENIFLCGQSLGGLSSLLTVLQRPESFGGAISQSASLWQPMVLEQLLALLEKDGGAQLTGTKFDISVGEQEWVLEPLHRDFVKLMEKSPAHLRYQTFNGGHDYACWRSEILPAFQRFIQKKEK